MMYDISQIDESLIGSWDALSYGIILANTCPKWIFLFWGNSEQYEFIIDKLVILPVGHNIS